MISESMGAVQSERFWLNHFEPGNGPYACNIKSHIYFRMEEDKMVNIDLLGITVLLRRLCEQGKLTDKEAKRILSRIAVQTGADLIVSL